MKNTLKDFGPVYVINLKSREDRLEHIKKEFNRYNVKDYTIVEAIDGSAEDLALLVENIEQVPLSKPEIATAISHLKAIKQWLETSESEYAVIIEDDLTFETVENWQWDWNGFLSRIDTYYDIIQLAIINPGKVNTSLHYREIRDFSAACYVIKRSWAKTLISKHIVDDKFIFNGKDLSRLVADGLVYNGAICLSFPLFTYSVNFKSSINEEHVHTIHTKSRNETLKFWKTNPKTLYRKLN
jgi:GR25 family glycosyltransferase involved in LPS biosynthesis